MEAANENEPCSNVFALSLRIHRIPLSEEEGNFVNNKFCKERNLGVYTESKSDKKIEDKPKKKELHITESFYTMQALMGSQCRDMRRGKMWFCLRHRKISLAAEL